jgi:hypothetical protein
VRVPLLTSTPVMALILSVGACARNKAGDQAGAVHEPPTRIRDTTLAPRDTTNPNDALPHIRDGARDTTRADTARH